MRTEWVINPYLVDGEELVSFWPPPASDTLPIHGRKADFVRDGVSLHLMAEHGLVAGEFLPDWIREPKQ